MFSEVEIWDFQFKFKFLATKITSFYCTIEDKIIECALTAVEGNVRLS